MTPIGNLRDTYYNIKKTSILNTNKTSLIDNLWFKFKSKY